MTGSTVVKKSPASTFPSSSGTALLDAPSTHNVSINDVDFEIPDIFISEIADPNDQAGDGRYVELYNATDSDVDLGCR